MPDGDHIVIDLTNPEHDDWLKQAPEALADLALSLPPETDLLERLRAHPDTPLGRAVLSGELEIPTDLPTSLIGRSRSLVQLQLDQLRNERGSGKTT